jgi:hypothetical protein
MVTDILRAILRPVFAILFRSTRAIPLLAYLATSALMGLVVWSGAEGVSPRLPALVGLLWLVALVGWTAGAEAGRRALVALGLLGMAAVGTGGAQIGCILLLGVLTVQTAILFLPAARDARFAPRR